MTEVKSYVKAEGAIEELPARGRAGRVQRVVEALLNEVKPGRYVELDPAKIKASSAALALRRLKVSGKAGDVRLATRREGKAVRLFLLKERKGR